MNDKIALLGIVEILSALSAGIFILFVTYKILRVYGRKRLHIDHENLAYNIIIASVLLSVGNIVSGAIHPIVDSFRIMSSSSIDSWTLLSRFIGFGALYIGISFALGLFISFVGMTIYSNMTPLNEADEIKNNNIGVALVVGAILVTLSFMCSDGIALLIESFIPYPKLPPTAY